MKNLFPIALVGLQMLSPAHSESLTWPNQQTGNPQSETVIAKQELSGSVLAVTDQDWKNKWATPPELKPSFNKAEAVAYGSKVFMLIFFSNPGQDQQQNSNVRCDLKIIDPTGVAIVNKQDMNCFSGQLASSPTNQYLSAPVISFAGEPGDPVGTWVVEVKLRDAIRQTELPLRTTFQLIKPVTDDLAEQPTDNPSPLTALAEPQNAIGELNQLSGEGKLSEPVLPSVTPTPQVKQPSSEADNWAVNLIAYKQLSLAQRKAEEFAAKGIPAKVSEVAAKGEAWYRLAWTASQARIRPPPTRIAPNPPCSWTPSGSTKLKTKAVGQSNCRRQRRPISVKAEPRCKPFCYSRKAFCSTRKAISFARKAFWSKRKAQSFACKAFCSKRKAPSFARKAFWFKRKAR